MNKTTKIEILSSENNYINACSEARRTFEGDSCWEDVYSFLLLAAAQIPADRLGYDKTDFRVTWEDGETYEGRLDLKNPASGRESDTNIAEHIRSHCIFYGGIAMTPAYRNRWHWMTEESYAEIMEHTKDKAEYLRFLDEYQLGRAA